MDAGQAVALGEANADLAVTGGHVFLANRDTFARRDVAVVDGRIAALPEDADPVIGPETTVLDASDCHVIPGLIDAHTHAEIGVTIERAVPHLLAAGTTTVVTEASGLGTVFGARGVEVLLEASADLPLAVYPTVPPQPLVNTFEPVRATEAEATALQDLLDRDRVAGVGEIDWIHVVGRASPVDALHERARELGARIEGHGAGCRGPALEAFAGIVDDDHEAIDPEGVRERADAGLHVVGRCGTIRDDLDALVGALDDLDPGTVSLSTDGVWPRDLRDGFGMADVVASAIDRGVAPERAIAMATRNPARHFGMARRGVLAPGAVADLVVLEELESMTVDTVLTGGTVVVEDGDPTPAGSPDPHSYPAFARRAVSLSLEDRRFTAPASATTDGIVRAMAVGPGLLTDGTTVEPAREGDRLVAAPDRDVLTATLLDRDPAVPDRGFTGFLRGYGLEHGAVATTATWEVPGLIVLGTNAADARAAAARVIHLDGGWAMAEDGEIVAELAMPIGGMAADEPVPVVADRIATLESALLERGVTIDTPLLTVQTLAFPGVPSLKLSFSGYADVLGRELVGLEPPNTER